MQDADPMLRGLVGHAERQDRPTSQADDLAVRTNEDQLGAMHSQLPQAPQEKQAVLPELPPMPAGLLYKSHAQGFPCHDSLTKPLSLSLLLNMQSVNSSG